MRSLICSLLLAAATMGIWGALPSEAQAQSRGRYWRGYASPTYSYNYTPNFNAYPWNYYAAVSPPLYNALSNYYTPLYDPYAAALYNYGYYQPSLNYSYTLPSYQYYYGPGGYRQFYYSPGSTYYWMR